MSNTQYQREEDTYESHNDKQFDWQRDIRLLVCIGVIVITFIFCWILMAIVFDTVSDIFTINHLVSTDYDDYRILASTAFGAIVAIIVGAAASMWLFKEDEVDDSIFEA